VYADVEQPICRLRRPLPSGVGVLVCGNDKVQRAIVLVGCITVMAVGLMYVCIIIIIMIINRFV